MDVDCIYYIKKKEITEPIEVENIIVYKDLIMFTDGLKTPSTKFFKRFRKFFGHFTTIQRSMNLPHFIFNLEGRECLHLDQKPNDRYSIQAIKNRHYAQIVANEIVVTKDYTIAAFDSFKDYTAAFSLLESIGVDARTIMSENEVLNITIKNDDAVKLHIKKNKLWN